MAVVTHAGRLHVPLTVHDALRRGRPRDAERAMREANPGLDAAAARDAVQRLAADPAGSLDDDDPYRPRAGAAPIAAGTLPSEVAAKIATGNTLDAAKRLRDAQPGLSEDEAREAVSRHCSPLLREAREETVVAGDGRDYGWVGWVLALVVLGVGGSLWFGAG